jgi:hypothetical protein
VILVCHVGECSIGSTKTDDFFMLPLCGLLQQITQRVLAAI